MPSLNNLICPTCHGNRLVSTVELSESTRLRVCRDCQHGFVENPQIEESAEKLYDAMYEGFREDPVFEAVIQQELTANFVSRIAPPARILDVGCGRGDFLAAAAARGYGVVGVDVSQAAVRMCRSRRLQTFHSSLADFQSIDLFDFVTMWDVLEHVPEPVALLVAARRLLKPGGYLVVKTPSVSHLTVRVTSWLPALAGILLQIPAHIQFFTGDSLQRMVVSAGFSEIFWLKAGTMRGRRVGGPLAKRVARLLTRTITMVGGDGNFYFMVRT